jgi:hypothetical protein
MSDKPTDAKSGRDFDQELFNFYKESYEAELERKDKLLERLNIALTQLAILGGALGFYVMVIPDVKGFLPADLFFYIPCGLACLSFLGSLGVVFYGVVRGDVYEYMPTSIEIAEAVEQNKKKNPNSDIRASFVGNFGKQYCQCAATNWESNQNRNGRVNRIFQFLVVCMIFLILALPGYLRLKGHLETKPTEVKIVNK